MVEFILHNLDDLPTRVNGGGYVVARFPTHPNCWKRDGEVYYHRLVLENRLGRYLTCAEVVHHVDGNSLNNHPDNLEVANGYGQHRTYHRLDLLFVSA